MLVHRSPNNKIADEPNVSAIFAYATHGSSIGTFKMFPMIGSGLGPGGKGMTDRLRNRRRSQTAAMHARPTEPSTRILEGMNESKKTRGVDSHKVVYISFESPCVVN